MYIRNWEKENIPFSYKGKKHIFLADSLIYVDEEEIPYSVLASAFGSHRLSKIDDKYVTLNKDAIGSNFDEFLEEEGIKEEVEQKAIEKLEEIIEFSEEEKEEIIKNAELCNPEDCENCGEAECDNHESHKDDKIEENSSELIQEKPSRRGRRSNKGKN